MSAKGSSACCPVTATSAHGIRISLTATTLPVSRYVGPTSTCTRSLVKLGCQRHGDLPLRFCRMRWFEKVACCLQVSSILAVHWPIALVQQRAYQCISHLERCRQNHSRGRLLCLIRGLSSSTAVVPCPPWMTTTRIVRTVQTMTRVMAVAEQLRHESDAQPSYSSLAVQSREQAARAVLPQRERRACSPKSKLRSGRIAAIAANGHWESSADRFSPGCRIPQVATAAAAAAAAMGARRSWRSGGLPNLRQW